MLLVYFFSIASVFSQLSGTYTIGSTGNYTSFNDAVNALTTNGISGPVVFNVQTGTYNERFIIPAITGTSASNTITFQSQTGDSSDVLITHAFVNSDSLFIVKFDTTSYITFKSVSFNAVNTTTSELYDIILLNNSKNISFLNCSISGLGQTGGPWISAKYIIQSIEDSISADNLIISNSEIKNGGYGIYLIGKDENTKTSNVNILNNKFTDIGSMAIELKYYNKSKINDNNLLVSPWYYGIYLNTTDSINIIKNNIDLISGNKWGIYISNSKHLDIEKNKLINLSTGIYLYGCDNELGNESKIFNNFISSYRGIDIDQSDYYKIYNNSINSSENSLNLAYGNYIECKNNIFNNKSSNSCLNIGGGTNLIFDYNDIYTSGSILGTWAGANCANLSEWQSTSGQDANSISVNPDFLSNDDLHTYSLNINNKAVSLSEITTDIDDETRDASNPDIGADEFTPLAYNLAILDLQSTSTGCGLSDNQDITIKIVNKGTAALSSIHVTYTIDSGITTVAETIPITINANDTAIYTFTNKADFSIPGDYICTAYTDLSNDEYRNDDTLHSDLITSYGDINSFTFTEDFETENTYYFRKKNSVLIENIAGNNSSYGVSLSGGDFTGGSNADSAIVWGADESTFPTLYSCNVDISSLTNPVLQFDIKITNNNFLNQSWFRVLINDTIQIPDIDSNYSQHSIYPTAYLTKTYNLSNYTANDFKLSLQANTNYEKIYVDNIKIGNAPIVNLGTDIVLCQGDSAIIDAGSGTGYTYAWFAQGNNDTLGTNQTIKLGATNNYYVDVHNTGGIVSSDTINITVNPTYFYTETQEICNNDSLHWHNNYYNLAGTFYDSLQTINGCDSIYELQLIVNPTYFFTETQEICDNDSLLWHGNYYNLIGTYYDSLQTTNGCDSIFELQLIVNPTYLYTETHEICDNDSLLWRGFYYKTSGIYYDSLQTISGCDSVYQLQLITNPTYYFTEQYQTCDNDNLLWHGNYYNISGTYYDSLQTTNGCDSIYEMSLIVNPTYYFNEQYEICDNDSLLWHGNFYNIAGTYFDNQQTTNGCDSIFEMQLLTNPTYIFNDTLEACESDSVLWRENYYSIAGTYYDSLQTTLGCDSVYAILLITTPVYYITEELNSCSDTAEWHGNYYTQAGTYYDSLQTISGCDSIYEVQISFNQKYYIIESDTICDSYNGTAWHGQYITQSGTYYDYLTTQAGCDSTFEYHCTFSESTSSEEEGHICIGDIFEWHGNTYTQGGWYYDTLQTTLGCDSVCKLVLNVNDLPTGTFHGPDTAMYGDTVNYIFSTYDNIDSWNIENGTILEYLNPLNVNVVWDTVGVGKIYVIYDNGGNYPCYDTTYKNVYISTVGINNIENNTNIKIYPNPTKKYIYIDYNKYFKARVYNILGEMILETEERKIDMSLFNKGNYIVKITDKKGRIIKISKIVKNL